MIYVYLKKKKTKTTKTKKTQQPPQPNQLDKQTELCARTDLKHTRLFLSHPYFLKFSVDSKEMGAILVLHRGIYPL